MSTDHTRDLRTCARCGRRRQAPGRRPGPGRRVRAVFCIDCVYATSGPKPLVVDEATPCYRSEAFFDLERLVESATETTGNVGRRLAAKVEREAEPICGECDVARECLKRMTGGGRYTGVAGGRLIVNGRMRSSRKGQRKDAA